MKAILPKSVLALTPLAAETNTRHGSTTGVLLTASGGNCRCEATNGRLLGIIHGYAEGDIDIVIDAKKIAEIKKVMGKEDTSLVIDVDESRFSAGGININKYANGPVPTPFEDIRPTSTIGGECMLRPDIRWPNTNQVIPSGKVACTFKVDAAYLIELLRCAIAVHNGKEACPVTFTVFKDRGEHKVPIALTAKAEDGSAYFDAVLVPLVDAK